MQTLLLILSMVTCRNRPYAGGPCRVADQIACSETGRALLCDGNSWVEVPCRGPHGCARNGEDDECDDTIANEGDRCTRNPTLDYACSAEGSDALVCRDGLFRLWRRCRGPDACRVIGGRTIRCDTTLGEPGDPCAHSQTYACSVDHKSMLFCDGERLSSRSLCRGPSGCHIDPDGAKVSCDDSSSLEGDACDRPRRIACASDRTAELICEEGRYVRKRPCTKSPCQIERNTLFCE